MPAKNKNRGNRFERKLVNIAKAKGFKAERAWGSDGKSLGLESNVDILLHAHIGAIHLQAKKKKKISDVYKPDSNIFGQVIGQDREEPYVVIRYNDFLRLI